jgi:hypothetical protein
MKIEHLDNSSEVRTALGICTPEPKGLSETKLRNSAAANPIRTDEPKLRPTQAVSVRTNPNHQPSTRQFARAKPNSSPSKPVPHERTQTIRHPYANSRERSQTPVQQATSTRTNPNIRRPHTDSRERTQTPAPASRFRTDAPKPSAIHASIHESEPKLQPSKPFPHGRTQTIRRPRTNSRERSQTPAQQAIPARTNSNHQPSTRRFEKAKPNSSPQQAISARTNPNIRHRQYQFTQAKP